MPESFPLTPKQAVERVSVQCPHDEIEVFGIAAKISPFPVANPRLAYVTVREDSPPVKGKISSMVFRTAWAQRPELNARIRMRGRLSTRLTDSGEIEVQLHGELVDQKHALPVEEVSRNRPQIYLRQYVDASPVERLFVLGSATGRHDVQAQLRRLPASERPQFLDVRVTDGRDLVLKIQNALQKGAQAVAVVRGGDDPTIQAVFDDPHLVKYLVNLPVPYYTAVGHASSKTLADRWADESFEAPSALGIQLARYYGRAQAQPQVPWNGPRTVPSHSPTAHQKTQARPPTPPSVARQSNTHSSPKVATTRSVPWWGWITGVLLLSALFRACTG
ncbi:hypothetical protein GO986_09170 [Deinococcus sp. HMF7620]|uniref:Exonuclease VII large subunit C-terminal domain-containing protein n=1 Tax=Deinococcus arboris TaxID=2682977 RepID=A0A7C9HZD6_9DEIO|nr:hypothetical protein [Deinococcus arboris]